MDKTLQPYESHIPFLLQFLMDYNLYGMGHLHASKVRFLYPVPDVFSQRKVKLQGKLRPLADDSTCMDFQADLGGDLCLNTPIWISSTIPDEWMWRYLPEPGSSTNEDFPRVRRQSASELEVDAVVHDIINQQFISYASLSQTHSEVKMIQSLIPIWEDEYERNGVPEAIPLAFGKPLPQDITGVADDIGVGIHCNPFVLHKNQMYKYGFVRMHDLVQDILEWKRFYLSGRLQKPVNVIVDNLEIEKLNPVNLKSVGSAALLLLPPDFTEVLEKYMVYM